MTRRFDLPSNAMYMRGHVPVGAHQPLTDREWTILQLVAAGLSNREIAEQLTLSPTTVKWYIKQIFNKLGAHRRTQAVQMASELHLLEIASPEFDPRPAIPKPVTILIGREKEVNEIINLLNDPAVRLVTILGPGGIGKTRLALEVAKQLAGHQPGQVCFAALDAVVSLSGLAQAAASAIGFRFHGQLDLERQLHVGLRNRKLLLALDNLEHLPEAGRFINEMLEAAPRLKILATSRERLHLSAETVFSLSGLDYSTTASRAEDYAAFMLFMKVARCSQPTFQPKDADMIHICRICQLVEGMPLAIELAAAWIDLLTPEQIAEEIAHGITILQTTLQDLPERHRSMRAVFERSWQLLSEEEQGVFKKLSVFRGGFDRAAAEQVTGATLFMLSALVDKSLLMRDGPDRFKLHELVRQFAQEKLQADIDEYTLILHEHCQYYASIMEGYERGFKANMSAVPNSILSVQKDFDNILAGWHYALEAPLLTEIGKYVFPISLFFAGHDLNSEGEQEFAQALRVFDAHDSLADSPDRVRLMTHYGWFLLTCQQLEQACQIFEDALELTPMLDHSYAADVGFLLAFLGLVLYLNDKPDAGRARAEQGLTICQTAEFQFGVWLCFSILGEIERGEGRHETAYHYHQRALTYSEEHRGLFNIPYSLGSLGWICATLGRVNEALDHLRRGLTINRDLLIVDPLLFTILGIAELHDQRGQPDAALELLAIILHHSQYGVSHPSMRITARILWSQIQSQLSAEHINTVMEKAKQGQLSSRYLDPHFTVSSELIDRLLELLDQVEKP